MTSQKTTSAPTINERHRQNRRYLAAIAVANDLFRCGLIDEADYSALETKFAAKYLPLFRYEKPCLSATLPIRQTVERKEFYD